MCAFADRGDSAHLRGLDDEYAALFAGGRGAAARSRHHRSASADGSVVYTDAGVLSVSVYYISVMTSKKRINFCSKKYELLIE